MTFPLFSNSQIEEISKILGECGSGSEITLLLNNLNLSNYTQESTKWRRLSYIFKQYQTEYKSSNHMIRFIKEFLSPVRFVTKKTEFDNFRNELNIILAFSGLEYGKDGEFRQINKAITLDEAQNRIKTIESKFKDRQIHSEVKKYCSIELMQDNYFHAVFEAVKGLAQRIRDLSGIQEDGARLVETVFSIEKPLLAFNSLQTETEKSEHKGFALLLKGCFGYIRNPLGHEPKIIWSAADDAADHFTLISMLHRKLDKCFQTRLS